MGRRDRLDLTLLRASAPAATWVHAAALLVARQAADAVGADQLRHWLLDRPAASGFAAGPRDFRPADPEAGRQVLAGRFALAGASMDVGAEGDPWDRPSPSRLFAVALHRFSWAPDLLAIGEAGSRELLRLFLAWQGVFGRLNAFSWGPEALERRVFNLACSSRRISAVASDAETQMVAASLASQARRLLELAGGPPRAAERLAAVSVAGAALGGKAGEGLLAKALPRLSRALAVAVLPDGGMRSRSPQQGLELLLDLLTLDDALLQRGREAPVEVARAIDRLSGALRFFALPDGRLAAFQGGEAASPDRVDAARAHEDSDAKPFGYAPHSGYHRLSGATLQVVVDAAPPAEGAWSLAACAHPAAMEVMAGKDRLFVNPGWSPNAAAPQAMRLTAAATTACLDDASAGRPLTGFLARALGPRLVGGPARVEARRNENEGGVWLEIAQDGWSASHGLIHERRLFLDPAADELRGEDRFAPAGEIANAPARYTPYAVRFHLHPDVQVSIARDGKSVLLRGASDRGWWFRNDAQEVTLEPSAWFENGLPRRTAQIVLRGHVSSTAGARVRWKLAPVEPEAAKKR